MTLPVASQPAEFSPASTDEQLVAACLEGNQSAWAALVTKYRRLVYSVPVKYRMSAEDAADIFQAVWMDLIAELPALRNTGALRSWLLTVASHKCYHRKRRMQLQENRTASADLDNVAGAPEKDLIEAIQREQMIRDALVLIPPRCRRMVEMLFYEQPPLQYKEVAARLGLAEGSIGFIRGRCLQKLRARLEEMGF